MGSYILPSGGIHFIKQTYPGWGILLEKLSDRVLTAKDLNNTLGLSYRQLNDWEKRGILKSIIERPFVKKAEGWRRFSIIDLIYLGILINLKHQGIPVTKLIKTIDTLKLNRNLYEEVANFIFSNKIVFYSDLKMWTGFGILSEDENFPIDSDAINKNKIILILPLNEIIKNILLKIKLPDLKIIINKKSSNINFIINNVPLALEKLPEK